MIQEFQNYIEQIILLTWGFKPSVKVIEPFPGTIQIWIEGTPDERAMIMGRKPQGESKVPRIQSITAITKLAHVFARRHNCFVYVYVKSKDTAEQDTLDDSVVKQIS